MAKKDIYQEHGYKDRDDYLKSLAEEYEIDADMVFAMADMLGPNEDFDGLVIAIEDYGCISWGG